MPKRSICLVNDSFPPVIDGGGRTLILGTMPSVKSLEAAFYYAHPRNAFWRILAETFEEAPPRTVEEKKALLLRHDVALWDTAHSCVRKGSLDADMREVQLNDVRSLLQAYPRVTRVLLNGQEAARLYRRGGGETALALDELEECIAGSDTAEGALRKKELQAALNRFLEALPERERMIFVTRYWYLRSVKEISEKTGLSLSSVKTQLFRTRNKLRFFLEKEDLL